MAPTFCKAVAEAWIAANASLLNFCFVVMAYLHKASIFKQLSNLVRGQTGVALDQQKKSKQLVAHYVFTVLLGKEVLVDSIFSALRLGQNRQSAWPSAD